jgi:hypothetical protein
MRRMVGAGVLLVLAVVGLGACNTPSGLDVERRIAAEAYRVERGDWSATASDARCEVRPYQETDTTAFVVTDCVVRGYSYHLQANYGDGPKGSRTSVDIRAYYEILPSQLVVKCTFKKQLGAWQLTKACIRGDFEPRP